jgi:phospholipase C
MPAQEPGTRPHRPTVHQPFADVTVNRATGQVTAALTNTGTVGVSLAVYPDAYLPFTATPFTVLAGAPRSYVWEATPGGKYAFSVYGPDGFLTSVAGQVVPAGQDTGPVPVVTAAPQPGPAATLDLTLANQGRQPVTYTLTPNDYQGRTQTVIVKLGGPKTISWPTDQYGYYDVIITTSTGDGYRRRYAGRIA